MLGKIDTLGNIGLMVNYIFAFQTSVHLIILLRNQVEAILICTSFKQRPSVGVPFSFHLYQVVCGVFVLALFYLGFPI